MNSSVQDSVPSAKLARLLAGASRADLSLLVLLALPWAILYAGANWVSAFVGKGFIDPWVYLGFFLDLRTHLRIFPATYYGSRLSWILPGHLAYKVLPPRIAAYALHFGVYYVSIFSLYFTLKHAVGRRAALITATLMGGYCFFLWSAGWDYVDGAGIMYFLLTTLALTLASDDKHPWIWLTLAGAFYAAMVYSQLFLIVFTPMILCYYFIVKNSMLRCSLFGSAVTFALGFLFISVVLGLVNYRLGGDFLFYTPSVRSAINLTKTANPWRRPFHAWWKEASWLVIPSVIFVSSLIALWKFTARQARSFEVALQLYYLSCASILVVCEIRGMPVLQTIYYASFLMPGFFLAMGGQIGSGINRLNTGLFLFVLCEATMTPLLVYRFLPGSHLASWLNSNLLAASLSISILGIAVLCVRERPIKIIALCSCFCLLIGSVNAAADGFLMINADEAHYGLEAIAQSVQAVRAIEPNGNLLFWYQADETMGNYYRAVASTYLWGYTLLNERFPSLDGADTHIPAVQNQIVILSNDAAAFQKAATALRQRGYTVQIIAERRIQGGSIGWNMIFVALEQAANAGDTKSGRVYFEDASLTTSERICTSFARSCLRPDAESVPRKRLL